jgi:hypothetical protein
MEHELADRGGPVGARDRPVFPPALDDVPQICGQDDDVRLLFLEPEEECDNSTPGTAWAS